MIHLHFVTNWKVVCLWPALEVGKIGTGYGIALSFLFWAGAAIYQRVNPKPSINMCCGADAAIESLKAIDAAVEEAKQQFPNP